MFEQELRPYQDRLAQHPIYGAIRSVEHVRIFMSHHVFAVWDFMSLAKRLQRDFTCVELPWMPVLNEDSARLINEIITGEESDIGHDGHPVSHFRLYLDAMTEVSAPTEKIDTFIRQFAYSYSLGKSLDQSRAPAYVKTFVKHTIKTARNSSTAEVASSFLFGREDPIPQMFQTLMERWGLTAHQAPKLTYYLNRHIEVDSGDHGPGAQKILSRLIITPQVREKALQAAIDAIEHRIKLWNGIYREIKKSDAYA
ncbi:DUF3050 domain-containing protein [Pseudomonas sp. BE134]|uniref:DUF3050 domain-containing protein n=1 Tax=Pseudomonas sp. BE134 TaxID=2817843 RepID=UPI00285C0CE0|nr:DUF3050 domain-containing protein [Pseudomonas sp. BE134]MDR6925545.1 hypothetical protein [Pseudomonas sp. BE134]